MPPSLVLSPSSPLALSTVLWTWATAEPFSLFWLDISQIMRERKTESPSEFFSPLPTRGMRNVVPCKHFFRVVQRWQSFFCPDGSCPFVLTLVLTPSEASDTLRSRTGGQARLSCSTRPASCGLAWCLYQAQEGKKAPMPDT